MESNDMDLKLPDSVLSQQDLQSVIGELRGYASWQARSAVKKKVTGKDAAAAPQLSPAAAELLAGSGQPSDTSQPLEKLIKALEQYEAKAPRLSVTLAAPAPLSLKRKMTAWARQNLDPGALVDFKFNATILGGMVVSYGSHTFDWSFRRQILANRQKFPEVLRNV